MSAELAARRTAAAAAAADFRRDRDNGELSLALAIGWATRLAWSVDSLVEATGTIDGIDKKIPEET